MFLRKIHGHSQGIIVKIFLSILGASFALWGIADVVKKYWDNRPIARVGNIDVSHEELAHMLNQETNQIQQMYDGKLDPATLKKLQLHTLVLERLINAKALTQFFKNMHFNASDALIGDIIRAQYGFKKDGVYDGALLRKALQDNHISEPRFLEQIREDVYTRQLTGTLASALRLPKAYVDIITNALTTKHTYTAVTIPFSAMHIEKKATDEDINLWYEQKKESYRNPEYRSVHVVVFDQAFLSKNIKLTEDEISIFYSGTLADYTQQERRMVRRVTYPNLASAATALAHLKKGRPMTAVIRDVPGGTFDDMGLVEKETLSENVRAVVFSLKAGVRSEPVENGTGYSIYEVTRIDPETTQPLASVRAKIEEHIRAQKYPDHFQELRNSFDDDLAGGMKLSDAAAKHNLRVNEFSSFNKNGETNKKIDALAALSDTLKTPILEQAFLIEEGKDSVITDVTGNQAFVVHVDKITPSLIPELATIKDTVKNDWELNQKREAAFKLAATLTKDQKDLHVLKYAKEHHYLITPARTVRRVDFELKEFKDTESGKFFSSLTPQLQQKLFTVPVGQTTYAELPNNTLTK